MAARIPIESRTVDLLGVGRRVGALPHLLLPHLLLAHMLLLLPAYQCAPSCSSATNDVPDVINVGVFVWADSDELILSRPISTYAPIPLNSTGASSPAPSLLQPFYLGVEFYITQLAQVNGGRIPVQGGAASIALNVSYINLGRVDWNNIVGGFPMDGFMSIMLAGAPGGLFDRLVLHADSLLGANRTFTFFVPHPFMGDLVVPLLNRIEDDRLAIMVHPLVSNAELCVCDGVTPPSVSATPDCTALPYDRKRLLGARRFETLFSTLPDLSNDASTTLDLMYTVGAKRIAIVRDAFAPPQVGTYGTRTVDRALAYATELNLQVVQTVVLEPLTATDCAAPGDADNRAGCPPAALRTAQNQVWPNGTTAGEWAARLRDAQVDAVLIVATSGTPGAWAFARLIVAMQAIQWTPSMLSFVGAFEKYELLPYLPNGKDDMLYTTGEIVWHPNLRGTDYQARTTSTNFEVVEANATHSTPLVFTDRFNGMYGPTCNQSTCVAPATPGTAHPFWNSQADGGTMSMIGFTAMVQVQKLIEAAASADVNRILATAYKVDVAAGFHRLSFDPHGQTRAFPVVVTQYRDLRTTSGTPSALESVILVPANIGEPPVYPMPTWEDRVFVPTFYNDPVEHAIIALTAVALALILVLMSMVACKWYHPLIRASTSSFSIFVALGATSMLLSNLFNLLHMDSARCAAQAWLLTMGFTLMLSSIVIKTYRIHRIFNGNLLRVHTIPNASLYVAIAAYMLVEVSLNGLWLALDGFPVRTVELDPLRPRLNYVTCDYSSPVAQSIIYLHIVWKAAILVGGIYMAGSTRSVPTNFNDSLIPATYNLSVVTVVVLPMVALNVGGRSAALLIRALGIIVLALSTEFILYAPKLYRIFMRGGSRRSARIDGAVATQFDNTNNTRTHSGTVPTTPVAGGTDKVQKKTQPFTTTVATKTPLPAIRPKSTW